MKLSGGRMWRWFWKPRARVIVALLLAMLVLRLVWGWVVHRQVEGKLAELHAQGHPIALSELPIIPVADEENAWVWQEKAGKLITDRVDSPRNSTLVYPNYPPYPPEWMKLAEGSEKAYGEAFRLARRARGFSKVQMRKRCDEWPVDFPFLNDAHGLANVIADGAQYMQIKGDEQEAINRVLDLLHIARSLRRDPFVMSQLVAMGIDGLACDSAEVIGATLKPEKVRKDSPTRGLVQELIRRLLDEEDLSLKLAGAVDGERLSWTRVCTRVSEDTWLIRPLAERDMERGIPNFSILHKAALSASNPAAKALLSRLHWEKVEDVDNPLSKFLQSFMRGNSVPQPQVVPRYSRWFYLMAAEQSRSIERHFQTVAERRTTAVALAWHLYRIDHGKWPKALDELVPEYLPAIPADPFRADGGGIGYVTIAGGAAGRDRPMLYFEGGADHPPREEPTFGWILSKTPERQYRDLSVFVPPSAKTINNNPRKADAPRDKADPEEDRQ